MKTTVTILFAIIIFVILIVACEKHNDPFSASNKKPAIEKFSFDDDSLKYKTDEPFKITLKYDDDENQKLTATIIFISGSGDIYQSSFTEVSNSGNTIIFDAPSSFDGTLNFIPDTTGKVEIELELTDKVKQTTQKTETFFYSNLNPVANFHYQLSTTQNTYELDVDASSSYDPDKGKIEWYYWLFDDGTPEIPTKANTYHHTYTQAGTYTVRLRVEDDDGGIDSTFIVIPTDNRAPVANLDIDPRMGAAPLTISFTASDSYDPDGYIVAYRINFDDGSSTLDSAGVHTYEYDKAYNVKLTVQDNLGQTNAAEVIVAVDTPPVAIIKVTPSEGPFPLDCIIDGTDSYDPQGGKIEHDIYIDGNLRYDNVDSVVHAFDAPERYLVRLVVTSKRNEMYDEIQQAVTVKNLNPRADFVWEPEIPQHLTPVTYTSTSIDSNLTDEISYYKWTFPHGVVEEGEKKNIVIQTFDAGVDTYKVKLEVWDKFRDKKFEGYDSVIKIIPKQ